MSRITFHESYGTLSVAQLALYKKANVSPSDHNELADAMGDDHSAIVDFVTAHTTAGSYRAPWPFIY